MAIAKHQYDKTNQNIFVMKKLLLMLLAAIFSVSLIQSQELESSLLWKVSGNGLEKSSYIYGTLHLLCPEELNIQEKVKRAMKESDQLVMELDFDDPKVMPKVQRAMMYSDGTTAQDYLNEQEYQLVSDFFTDSLNIPFERLQGIKPFFLSSMTVIHFLGCQPVSFEQQLTAMAKEANMEVKGLETVKEQISFIESIPKEKQKKMLVEGLQDYSEAKRMFDEMVDHYLNEEISGINRIMEEYMSDDYAEMQHNLLIKRNKKWVDDMKQFMQKHSSFVAVGSGHLPGEQGLVTLLRKAGYTVEAIN